MPQDMQKAFKPRLIKKDDLYGEKAGYRLNIMKSMKLLIKTRCLKILIQNSVQK